MGTKLYIKTYGCQMNEYDSEKTVDILKEKRGVEVTSNIEEADIILLNTCSIRDKAEAKVFSELGRLNKLKIKNPNLKLESVAVSQPKKDLILKKEHLM